MREMLNVVPFQIALVHSTLYWVNSEPFISLIFWIALNIYIYEEVWKGTMFIISRIFEKIFFL